MLLARIAAVLGIAIAIAACGEDAPPLSIDEYFSRVSALHATLDTSSAQQTATAREAALRNFAAALDDLRPPSSAKDAHHDLTVASKNLADAIRRTAASATVTPDDAGSIFVLDWERACHLLQDLALAKEIDVDLRCVTALHDAEAN